MKVWLGPPLPSKREKSLSSKIKKYLTFGEENAAQRRFPSHTSLGVWGRIPQKAGVWGRTPQRGGVQERSPWWGVRGPSPQEFFW